MQTHCSRTGEAVAHKWQMKVCQAGFILLLLIENLLQIPSDYSRLQCWSMRAERPLRRSGPSELPYRRSILQLS